MNSTLLTSQKYRPDIDGLRAIAVLAVVLFHASPGRLRAGFVGVDIFFVISGFLISTIIFEQLESGQFSFKGFYARRIRRIFPALIVMLVGCLVFGWMSLFTNEYRQLGKHFSGAGIFSNFLLWKENGYFENAAETKPLLHLWSLGIEEQFYIFWPLIVWGVWKLKKNLIPVMIVLFLSSFSLNIWRIQVDPTETFFLPHTRIWELLAGCCLAYVNSHKKIQMSSLLKNLMSVAGFLLIVFACGKIPSSAQFPGIWALLPVGGAVLLIAAGPEAWINNKVLSQKILVWIGLISYPLYLWHWPLLSFARILEGDLPSAALRSILVILAFLISWFIYKWVETPLRHFRVAWIVPVLTLIMVSLMLSGFFVYVQDGLHDRPMAKAGVIINQARADWHYSETALVNDQIEKLNIREGRSSKKVLFVGDSTMGQYFPRVDAIYALEKKPLLTTIYASRNHCRPLPLFEMVSLPEKIQCADYYKAVLKMAQDADCVKIVFGGNWPLLGANGELSEQGELFVKDLMRLRDKGKKIYIISNPLVSKEFDPMFIAKKFRFNPEIPIPDSFISRSQIENKEALDYFKLVSKKSGAQIINPFDYFCKNDLCPTIQDNEPLFVDDAHIRGKTAIKNALFIDELVANF